MNRPFLAEPIEARSFHRQLPLITTASFLVLCFLGGGASRNDVLSLLYVQPVAVIACAVLLIACRIDWHSVRVPLALLAALAAAMAIQLIPLPPAVWIQLPAHHPFAEAADLAGIAQPWRPISLSPDLTLASLVGLVSPLCVLLGCAAMAERQMHTMMVVVLALLALSIVAAIGQFAGGSTSPLYLYGITNRDSGVGLFSNRNHQALFLSCGFPLLVAWAASVNPAGGQSRFVEFAAVLAMLVLIPMLLVTGSRAGILLGLLALGSGGAIYVVALGGVSVRRHMLPSIAAGGVLVAGLAAGFAYLAGEKAMTLSRVGALTLAKDSRFEDFGTLWRITRDFFPWGTGFGTFDPVYRMYEPHDALSATYLNQAHNDALDLLLAGGLPAVIVLGAFLAWFVRRAIGVLAWRGETARGLPLAAIAIIALTLFSSLVDYPLRTPAIASLFALACGWLSRFSEAASRRAAVVAGSSPAS